MNQQIFSRSNELTGLVRDDISTWEPSGVSIYMSINIRVLLILSTSDSKSVILICGICPLTTSCDKIRARTAFSRKF
jgi:hypothetical protein